VLGDNNGIFIWLDDNIDVNILCFHLGLYYEIDVTDDNKKKCYHLAEG
jgi:hypothetical protein